MARDPPPLGEGEVKQSRSRGAVSCTRVIVTTPRKKQRRVPDLRQIKSGSGGPHSSRWERHTSPSLRGAKRRSNPDLSRRLDCFAELVIGPPTSGRTRWLAMTNEGKTGSGTTIDARAARALLRARSANGPLQTSNLGLLFCNMNAPIGTASVCR